MRNTYFIQITKKRNAHMLFEKTAEIFPAESYLISYFFQREFFGVMFIYISNNLSQSIIRLTSAISNAVPSERMALVLLLSMLVRVRS